MSVSRQYGGIVFACDACSDTLLETGVGEWSDALAAFNAAQWHRKTDARGAWRHYCQECGEEIVE